MIPVAEPYFDEQELGNLTNALSSGWVSSKGKFIEEFEQGFTDLCGMEYGIATSSGTTALHLALTSLGIGQGDEVVVPSLTFVATANAVRYTVAKPVFVDSHPDYWCVDPKKIEQKITPRTKAIIPVHLYGHPCNMELLMEIAKRYGLYVIEDAAEAHGAEYKKRKVGSFGDISCFSFYGNKIITTGEGGMCLTNNPQLAERMKILRNQGMRAGQRHYWHEVVGFNYRLTNIQAALGVAQLKKLKDFIEKKRAIAEWYREKLKELEEEKLITLHPHLEWADPVYWMYSILINPNKDRDELAKKLSDRGIETRPFFYPLHLLPPYRNSKSLPVAEDLAKRGINLPSGVKLTFDKVEEVSLAIKEIIRGYRKSKSN